MKKTACFLIIPSITAFALQPFEMDIYLFGVFLVSTIIAFGFFVHRSTLCAYTGLNVMADILAITPGYSVWIAAAIMTSVIVIIYIVKNILKNYLDNVCNDPLGH